MDPQKRVFIAAEIPATVQIANVQTFVKNQIQTLFSQATSPFRPEKVFHLTLEFIGNISQTQIPTIINAVNAAIGGHSYEFAQPITGLSIQKGAQLFGTNAIALVLTPNPSLTDLANRIKTNLRNAGIPVSGYTFSGHMTLGRISAQLQNEQAKKTINQLLSQVNPPIGARATHNESFAINKIGLYESAAQQYILLHEFKLTSGSTAKLYTLLQLLSAQLLQLLNLL
jgi:2'-5' RNA ligase